MSTSLTSIHVPDYSRADFGRALSEQFANINTNFQKLGNLDLGKGEDGRSCIYITYNLNSIFVYPTVSKSSPQEYNAWQIFKNRIRGLSEDLVEAYKKMETEVQADYEKFKKITHGSPESYTAMCSYLLFGYSRAYVHSVTQAPTGTSLTGALWASQSNSLMGPVDITDSNNFLHTYRAVWLRDWFMTEDVDELVSIYRDHIVNFDPGKISIACSPSEEARWEAMGGYEPVGSLAYVYIDPRFRNGQTGSMLNAGLDQMEDASCVVYWEPASTEGASVVAGRFKTAHLFPQIYFNGNGFYWKINGKETSIPVTGAPGEPGKNSQFVVVERVENITGGSPDHLQGDEKLDGGVCSPWATQEYVTDSAYVGRVSRLQTAGTVAGFTETEELANGSILPVTRSLGENDITREYEINPVDHWLLTGYPDENNIEVNHCFRVLRVVGKEFFFTSSRPVSAEAPYRTQDPVFSRYNYGYKLNSWVDPVKVSDSVEIQNMISVLDGCPCIVVPGPSFIPGLVGSTVWFSTLKAVPSTDDPNSPLQLVVYCGPENQLVMKLDDNALASSMQSLDVFSYRKDGDRHHHARGLMLPIGSSQAVSEKAVDLWGAHFIHSDLGGFDGIGIDNNTKYGYFQVPDSQIRSNNYGSYLNSWANGNSSYQTQGNEVIGKRVLHIGSVEDYRSLDYIPGISNLEGQDNIDFTAAVPGRRPFSRGNKEYSAKYFFGSELHIDEPTTITSYRDLKRVTHLLNVEGDTTIGLRFHVNDPKTSHDLDGVGGLLIGSVLSAETISPLKDKNYLENFLTETYTDLKFLPVYSANFINVDAENGNIKFKEKFSGRVNDYRPSLLVKEMIGARFISTTEGLAVGESNGVNFSVDSLGNIQTKGQEVRSNAYNTLWAFHTNYSINGKRHPNVVLFGTQIVDNSCQEYTTLPGLDLEDISNWYNREDSITTRIGYLRDEIVKDGNKTVVSGNHTTVIRPEADMISTRAAVDIAGISKYPVNLPNSLDNIEYGYTIDSISGSHTKSTSNKCRFGLYVANGLLIKQALQDGSTYTNRVKSISHKFDFNADQTTKYGSMGENINLWNRNYSFNTSPGLWIEAGAMIRGNVLANRDMLVGRNATVVEGLAVGEQIRARSFRRRISAQELTNKTNSISLLFDDGRSSIPSPWWENNNRLAWPNYAGGNQYSPIVLDLGPDYKDKRIIKFGLADIKDDGTINTIDPSGTDHRICLFGRLTDKINRIQVSPRTPEANDWSLCDNLFDISWNIEGSKNEKAQTVNPFRVWGVADGGRATVWIQINLNVQNLSKTHRYDFKTCTAFGIRTVQTNPKQYRVWEKSSDNNYYIKTVSFSANGEDKIIKKTTSSKDGSTTEDTITLDRNKIHKASLTHSYNNVFLDSGVQPILGTHATDLDCLPIYWESQPGYSVCMIKHSNSANQSPEYYFGNDFPLGDYWGRYAGESKKFFLGADNIFNVLGYADIYSLVCTGFNWNKHLGESFPKPTFKIESFIPGINNSDEWPNFTSSYNVIYIPDNYFEYDEQTKATKVKNSSGINSYIDAKPSGHEDTGVKFCLTPQGYLTIEDASALGMLTFRPDMAITLKFEYPYDIDSIPNQKTSYHVTNMAAYVINNPTADPWNNNESGQWVYFYDDVKNPSASVNVEYINNVTYLSTYTINGLYNGWNFVWESEPGNNSRDMILKRTRFDMDNVIRSIQGKRFSYPDQNKEFLNGLTCTITASPQAQNDEKLGIQPAIASGPEKLYGTYVLPAVSSTSKKIRVTPIFEQHSADGVQINDLKTVIEEVSNKSGDLWTKLNRENIKNGMKEANNWVEPKSPGSSHYIWKEWVIKRILAYACSNMLSGFQRGNISIPYGYGYSPVVYNQINLFITTVFIEYMQNHPYLNVMDVNYYFLSFTHPTSDGEWYNKYAVLDSSGVLHGISNLIGVGTINRSNSGDNNNGNGGDNNGNNNNGNGGGGGGGGSFSGGINPYSNRTNLVTINSMALGGTLGKWDNPDIPRI